MPTSSKQKDPSAAAPKATGAKPGRLNAFMVQNAFSANFEEHQQKQLVGNPLSGRTIRSIDVDQVTRNPYQPRLDFDEDYIGELAKSIEENGLIEVIKVRAVPTGYELVAGECRLLAHKKLGLKTIDAEIVQITDAESAVQALAENIHRKNLSDLEIYLSLSRFESVFSTAKQVASLLEMSRAHFYRIKSFEKLPRPVIDLLKAKPKLITALSASTIAKTINSLSEQGVSAPEIEKALIVGVRDMISDEKKVPNLPAYLISRLTRKDKKPVPEKEQLVVGHKPIAVFERKDKYLQVRLDSQTFSPEKEVKLRAFLEQLALEA
jgi:ParB family chromosome partitioning protein